MAARLGRMALNKPVTTAATEKLYNLAVCKG
jgi:hypothetical protein